MRHVLTRLSRRLRGQAPRQVPAEWFDTPVLADARDACEEIPDESVDLVFTDPYYPDTDAYAWLGRTAARVLKPGRFLYAYSGNIDFNRVFAVLSRHLTYAGVFCLMGAGGQIHRWHMIACWKPVLRFVKGPLPTETAWMLNMWSSSPDKRYHRWGQGASPAFSTIRGVTKPGELVLDPFCGGGTTAAVCQTLGRRFLTFDIDPVAIKSARARLAWEDLPLFNGVNAA